MCGIIYAKRRDKVPANRSLIKRYHKQRGRGSDGFGFISIQNGCVVDVKRSTTEHDITRLLESESSEEILFHHRLPTSGPNIEEATHPIVVKNDLLAHNYYVAHNGVLHNEDELKKTHEALGFKYTTEIEEVKIIKVGGRSIEETSTVGFNDSESLAIDLALYLDGHKHTIDSVGSIAFVCIQTTKEGKILHIFYGRNSGNPLIIEDNNDLFFLKSAGHGTDVPEDKLFKYDYLTGETTIIEVEIGETYTKSVGYNTQGYRGGGNVDSPPDYSGGQGHPYADQNSTSYFLSHDRYNDLLKERATLLEDVKKSRKELKKAHKKNNSESIVFYRELIRECLESVKKIEGDVEWLDQYLNDEVIEA